MPTDNLLIRIFNQKNPYDEVATPLIDENKKQNETGMDRLQQIFGLDEYGYPSKEITTISQLCASSAIGSFVIGGVMRSRGAFVNFIENNQATQFMNHLDAKRKLQREMYLSFMKGGWHLGWRVGMFSLTFTSLMTGIAAYRGKDALLEYVVAGGVTGGLFKMNMGLKGMVAGSVLGTVLGTIGGTFSILTLKLGGVSMQDIRNFSKLIHDTRQNSLNETRKKYMLEEFEVVQKTEAQQEFLNMNVEQEPTKNQPA